MEKTVGAKLYKLNKHGHAVFEITGLDLAGAEEVNRLKGYGYRVSGYAEKLFVSTSADGYDKNHRLVAQKKYRVVLVPEKSVPIKSGLATERILTLATELGYHKPLAGVTPRIRELVSDEHMEELGFSHIVPLHDPITGIKDNPGMLGCVRGLPRGPWVISYRARPVEWWVTTGAFAFFAPT